MNIIAQNLQAMRRNISLVIGAVLLLIAVFLLISKKGGQDKRDENKIQLSLSETGRYLFFDTRLSYNDTKSCGSCHDPKFAFTDGYRRSITAGGENVKHNAPSLINIVYQHYFDWANPNVTTLEKQQERPLFSEHPPELGARGNETTILERLKADTFYQRLFATLFQNEKDPIVFPNIISSIAAFVRTLQSLNSPYDKFMNGDSSSLSSSEKAGMQLFFSERLKCSSCHTPPLFTLATKTTNTDSIYFNIGLYNVLNKNIYPTEDNGLAAITNNTRDDGKFKIPSLRNVSLTSPYMHDGSMNTLEEIIDMYARGGRKTTTGPFAGDGKYNSNKDKRINGFSLAEDEKKELISFLFCLTDSAVLTRPAFQNPFNLGNK